MNEIIGADVQAYLAYLPYLTDMEREQLDALLMPTSLEKYQTDPAGFGRDVLGEHYTDDVVAMMESVRDNVITVAKSGNAVGKSQPVETPVMTPDGWKPIGQIRVGDSVIGRDGCPVRVVGVYPQGLQPTVRVTFNDGTSTLCSRDHLWAVRDAHGQSLKKPYRVMTITEAEKIIYRWAHIPVCAPVRFSEKQYPVTPYLMGVLLGDGTLGQYVRFDSADEWIIERVRCEVAGTGVTVRSYRGHKTHYGITARLGGANPILKALQAYGLIGKGAAEKAIPQDYLLGSLEQRRNLLAGLLDTDGTIGKGHSITFDTISETLAYQVRALVNSLGGTATIKTRIPFYVHNSERRAGKLCYRVNLKTPFCPFSLPRKVERWRDPADSMKPIHRVISKVEPVGETESVCIRVANPDGLYLTEHCIVTHNSHGSARVAVWFYKVFSDAQVYTTAAPPENNLKRILWGEIGGLINRHPQLFAGDKLNSLHVERNAQSFLTGVAIPMAGTESVRQAKFSGKHAPHLLFIVDEGDAVPPEIYAGIESCMSGGMARLLVMFNPRSQTGPVWQMEKERRAAIVRLSALTHPNVVEGRDVIPGAVTSEVVVRRINEWSRPLTGGEAPDVECFEVPAYLVGRTATAQDGREYPPLAAGFRQVTQSALWYMVLGDYAPAGETQLISRAWIDAARARYDAYLAQYGERPPFGVHPVMGLDVAEFGQDANAVCLRYGGYVAPFQEWRGIDPDATAIRAAGIYADSHVRAALVDATGVGAGVAPRMERLGCYAAESVKVAMSPTTSTEMGEFRILRDQLWWAVREWLRADPGAMLPPDEELLEELATPTYAVTGMTVRVMEKDIMKTLLHRSPNKADALCLTFAEEDGATVEEDINPVAGWRG